VGRIENPYYRQDDGFYHTGRWIVEVKNRAAEIKWKVQKLRLRAEVGEPVAVKLVPLPAARRARARLLGRGCLARQELMRFAAFP
jgi:hypothetical protein